MAKSIFSKSAPVRAAEASTGLSAQDVGARLSRAVSEAHENQWAYYKNHFGDDDSGDVIYHCSDGDMRCPYDFDEQGVPVLHTDDAQRVMERVSYDEVPDDDDSYVSQMEESFVAAGLYQSGLVPLYERFISQGERDKADSGDFAGKGKSFPILKKQDVMAAVRSMGRAGSSNFSTDQLKKNIIRIAKKKGWGDALPKSWQGKSSESAGRSQGTAGSGSTHAARGSGSREAGLYSGAGGSPGRSGSGAGGSVRRETLDDNSLTLVESASVLEQIVLREAKADYEIKLIAPGKGSSAFYPSEVLKRDGPKVFKAGTHVYLNHPTAAEEAARPEGDVANLAGVLTTDATYQESHAKGPGLFARMKVFADHAQMVEEKAAHVGMSIRAFGQQESGKTKDGVPVLKELTSAESVDVVTRAGAGGMILTEAARAAEHQEGDSMTDAEAKELRESSARLLARALRSDAREQGMKILEGVTLPPASKLRVIDAVLEREIPRKDGELDLAKFTEAVNAEAKREGQYVASLTGAGRVTGMGAPGPVETDPAKLREAEQRQESEQKRYRESATEVFSELMGSDDAGAHAASFGDWKVKPIRGTGEAA